MESAEVQRARTLVFQAEDDLDGVAISLGGAVVTDQQRAELKSDTETVRFKAEALTEFLGAGEPDRPTSR